MILLVLQWRLVGGAIGEQDHCNGWNRINGTESNVVSICLIPFHYFHSSDVLCLWEYDSWLSLIIATVEDLNSRSLW